MNNKAATDRISFNHQGEEIIVENVKGEPNLNRITCAKRFIGYVEQTADGVFKVTDGSNITDLLLDEIVEQIKKFKA